MTGKIPSAISTIGMIAERRGPESHRQTLKMAVFVDAKRQRKNAIAVTDLASNRGITNVLKQFEHKSPRAPILYLL
jgi:hypothetical protein